MAESTPAGQTTYDRAQDELDEAHVGLTEKLHALVKRLQAEIRECKGHHAQTVAKEEARAQVMTAGLTRVQALHARVNAMVKELEDSEKVGSATPPAPK